MSIETTSNPNFITIVCDIDGVLVDNGCRNPKTATFFLRNGHIIQALATNYIFPGVAEFFQRLIQEPNIRLAFFSSGADKRNSLLCPQLLERALGPEKAQQLLPSIKVCSASHLVPHQGADKSYGLESGKTQKDLTKLGLTEQDLDNAVLIEDNASYVSFGQARNFLEVPATTSKDFMFLDRNIDQFDKAGYFSVPVSVLRKPYENQEDFPYITNRRSIAEGGHIEVCRLSSGGYQIAYKRRGLQEYVVDHLKEKENHELCESLANLNYSYDRAYLKNGEVLKQIHAWIEERGGETKIKKLYHEANRIYYVAGILFTALEQARNEQRSLSSVLCEMQYTATGEGSYKPKFSERQKEDRWYHRGLSELRKVNSALQFTHPINYCETIKPSLTEEEKQIINTSLKNEDDNGCVIM